MYRSALIPTLASLASVASLVTAVLVNAPIPGYGVVDIEWEVQAFRDGPKMILNGTVERVREQLLKINPEYDTHFAVEIANNTESQHKNASMVGLQKRAGRVCKRPDWNTARGEYIEEGIRYLRGVGGKPRNGPGPGNCGRVSCSYNSAIWWCNDNTSPKELPGFYTIADCAQTVLDNCFEFYYDHCPCPFPVDCDPVCVRVVVRGQQFYDDNWNCIVRYDSDNC